MDVAHDKTRVFKVDTYTCQAGKAMAKVSRDAAEKAKQSKKPDGWNDGLHYYVVPVDPEDLPERPTAATRARPTRGGKRG